MAETNLAELKKQIEYYLSDNNLKSDEFFYNQIKDSTSHSIPVESFLNCNKVKKLQVTKEDIIKAIADSEEVEASEDGAGVKRKNDKALPEFEPKVGKKLKTEGNSGSKNKEEKKDSKDNRESSSFDPQIFKITLSKADDKLDWKKVEEAIKNSSGVRLCYTRLNGTEGNFAVNKNTLTEEEKAKLVNGSQIGEIEVKVAECIDDDLKKFYAEHGKHLDFCLERSGLKRKQKPGKGPKKDDSVDFVFNNQRYTSLSPLKTIFNNILVNTMDGDEVSQDHHKLLVELLKYHENGEAKLKDLKTFTVGQHPSYKQTRCFFVVRNDGTKEDFSATKCLTSIKESNKLPEDDK